MTPVDREFVITGYQPRPRTIAELETIRDAARLESAAREALAPDPSPADVRRAPLGVKIAYSIGIGIAVAAFVAPVFMLALLTVHDLCIAWRPTW